MPDHKKKVPRLQIGRWSLTNGIKEYTCADCREKIPKRVDSFVTNGGTGSDNRRVCIGCMKKRQLAAGRNLEDFGL